MVIFKTLTVLGTLCGLGYYALCLWASRWFFRKRSQSKPSDFRPAVSILKPLCGADPNSYESLRSHCVQDYPDFQIIFGVNDPNDVVIPIVQRLIHEFPERNIQLVVCSKLLGSNYKVSNLIQMFPRASHEFLLVNDSDIHVDRRYLQRVMSEFADKRVGMVTSLYRGIAGSTVGSKLEGLGISTEFMPGVLSARQVEGGIHFALGSTLAFRKQALKIIGGFECVADYLGDDYEFGKRIAEAGYVVALADCIVDHYLPDYSFSDFLRHQLRWNRSTRHSRQWGYVGLIFTFGLPWAIAAVLVAPTAAWAWGLLAVTLLVRYAVAFTIGIGVVNDPQLPRAFWLIPFRDIIGMAIWLAGLTGRTVVWRGNQFILENGKLRPSRV